MKLTGLCTFLRRALPILIVFVIAASSARANSLWPYIPPQNTNLALGGAVTSSGGWGGGSQPWQITDGQRDYYAWSNGLALCWGCGGLMWAAVNLGQTTTFNEVVMWQHGTNYTPATTMLDYWDGTAWVSINYFQRLNDPSGQACHAPGGALSGYSDCDIYMFNSVNASAVRYSFYNNQLAIDGSQLVHGWIYEFEVYNQQVPEPGSLVLLGTGLAGLAGMLRRKTR